MLNGHGAKLALICYYILGHRQMEAQYSLSELCFGLRKSEFGVWQVLYSGFCCLFAADSYLQHLRLNYTENMQSTKPKQLAYRC